MVRGGLDIVIVVIAVIVAVVVVAVAVVVFVVGANEGKVYFAARVCRLCVKVNVGEEETASASADGG